VSREISEVAGIERLLEEMITAQHERLLALARRLAPELVPDDLLQPHDHPALAASPDFNFEDGILAGYLALRAALRASRRK
jgi:hypothetical protein